VLGLNDQIETDETNTSTGQGQNAGIGFATPANEDVKVANEIIAGKTVQHAYIGVKLSSPEVLSTNNAGGTTIEQVSAGSPAAKAGLKVNDVITKVDGAAVASSDGLISTLARYNPGQSVTLTIDRSGQTKQVKVTLGNRPPKAPTAG
jgi:putative serine protease PepD